MAREVDTLIILGKVVNDKVVYRNYSEKGSEYHESGNPLGVIPLNTKLSYVILKGIGLDDSHSLDFELKIYSEKDIIYNQLLPLIESYSVYRFKKDIIYREPHQFAISCNDINLVPKDATFEIILVLDYVDN